MTAGLIIIVNSVPSRRQDTQVQHMATLYSQLKTDIKCETQRPGEYVQGDTDTQSSLTSSL